MTFSFEKNGNISHEYCKLFYNPNNGNPYLKVFICAALVAAVIFLPFVMFDKGIFMQYGDYNVQQIPFYKLANGAVRDGNIWWNWNTDLGSNFIGSYSFYLLGSPFFWLTLPFPPNVVPYLMAPLFVLKFSIAAVTSYAYINRFVRIREYAMIGAFLYAFSSFQIFNVFFNHFHDVTAFFPLLLIALEELTVNNRKGVFALAVALMCTINYFFFFGQVLFLFIYFFLRCGHKEFFPTLKKFMQIVIESVLGVAMAAFLLLPSVLAIIDNSRLNSTLNGFNLLFYPHVERYGLIFQSFFFPHDIAARPNLFSESNSKWASVAAFLPLFSTCGVITFLTQNKGHWMRRILIISVIIAFIPGFNAMFFGLNHNYYARWFYMPILIMALVTAYVLENKNYNIKKGIKWTALIIIIFGIIGLLPTKVDDEIVFFRFAEYIDRYWINYAIALAGIIITYVLIKRYRYDRKRFFKYAMPLTCLIIVTYSVCALTWGRSQSYSHEQVVDKGVYGVKNFELPDIKDEFYRIDIYKGMDNWGMMWGMPTIQAFHSTVPASIMEFYRSIDVERSVGSRPEIENISLRALTSVRYLMVEDPLDPKKQRAKTMKFDGFEFLALQNGFAVFENTNFIPMGFTYNYYCDDKILEETNDIKKDALLLKAMHLQDDDVRYYRQYLMKYGDYDEHNYKSYDRNDSGDSDYDKHNYESYDSDDIDDVFLDEKETLKMDADFRRMEACDTFDIHNKGFNAEINLSRQNLVFFSVPYDEGWTATVNGKNVEIVKANKGFMAVLGDSGYNDIRFVYTTPGLYLGILITGIAVLLFVVYIYIFKYFENKR